MPKGYVTPDSRAKRDAIRAEILKEWGRRETFTPRQFGEWWGKQFPDEPWEVHRAFDELKREGHFHRIAGYGAGSVYAPGEANLKVMRRRLAGQSLEDLRRVSVLLRRLEEQLLRALKE